MFSGTNTNPGAFGQWVGLGDERHCACKCLTLKVKGFQKSPLDPIFPFDISTRDWSWKYSIY